MENIEKLSQKADQLRVLRNNMEFKKPKENELEMYVKEDGKKRVKLAVAGFTWLLNRTTYKVCF